MTIVSKSYILHLLDFYSRSISQRKQMGWLQLCYVLWCICLGSESGAMGLSVARRKRRFKADEPTLLPRATLASLESLTMPIVQEIVISADIRCKDCQNRIAAVLSRMTETESVVVNVLERHATVTCKCPSIVEVSSTKIPTRCLKSLGTSNLVKRIIGCSSR
ncbi:hypothetical protein AKJ16_DCAP12073 [Drosera capensis]